MRVRPAAIALVVLGLGGYLASHLYASRRTGPFELWTLRAGMPFSAIDDDEHAATKRRFICTPLEKTGRFCQLHGRTVNGMLRIFVDDRGRAAVIQFWPSEDNSQFGDEARRMAADWTTVRAPLTEHPDGEPQWAVTSRWRSMNNAFSATIQYSCFARTPTVIEVADDEAVADAIAAHPGAADLLRGADVIPPAEEAAISAAPRRAPGYCGKPKFTRPSA